MRIMQKIFTALSATVGLDSNGLACCYPNTLPQQPTYPSIVYQLLSEQPAAALTQLARFTDFHFQVTLHATTYQGVCDLRAAVLLAAEAMPEYITRDSGLEPPFEFEPKTFSWIVTFRFRDAES